MKKVIVLSIAGAAVLAAVASCAPRAEGAGTTAAAAASPGAAASASTAMPSISLEELRSRLMAAGLSVPKQPLEADDFEIASLTGGRAKLSAYRGRVVFLNFWATWCPPCRAEMPSMERLHRLLRERGLEIVAVDLQESKEAVRKFVKDNAITFTVLLDATGAVGGAWGVQSIPTTYLIDRKGTILARSVGGREWDSTDMVALFEAILAVE
jgi:DsbE subfamily thiol:disulfide oxidoreductase